MGALLDQGHEVSLVGLAHQETAEALVALQAMTSRLSALAATVTRHAVEIRAEESGNGTSLPAWLTHAARVSRPAAHRQVCLAEALGRYERVGDALSSGVANPEQAAVICRALDEMPADLDPALVEKAEIHLVSLVGRFGPKELRVLGRHVLTVVAPEVGEAHEARLLEDEERRAAERTRLTMCRDGHGLVHGRFSISELHGAMLEKALLSLTWNEDDPQQRAKPTPQRMGEAFGEMLERLHDSDLPSVGGTGATVVVTMSLETLNGGLAEAALDNGDRLSAATARRLACEAGIVPVVLGGRSQVLDLGRSRRYHSKAQRIAIGIRDKTCTALGCTEPPARCHVHHDTPWAQGGRTTVKDGRLLCPRHHRAIHHGVELKLRR